MKLLVAIIIMNTALLFGQVSNPAKVDTSLLKRYLRYLGSDLFEGRGTGQQGGDLSAKYLALIFDKLNLMPIGNNGTYYQYIPMHASKALNSSKLNIISQEKTTEIELGKDFLLYNCGEQTYLPTPTELVFVGYGIIANEFDYNDYQEINVEGKIAVMLSGEPQSSDTNYFAGIFPTIYSYSEAKQRLALSRGAKGTIIIRNPYENDHREWEHLKTQFAFEDVKLAYSMTNNLSVLLNSEVAQIIFQNSEYSFKEIIEQHFNNSIRSFPLNSKLTFNGNFTMRDFLAPNIIGKIEGSDKKGEYLILSAHYDHLGIGLPVKGDSIYNGVMDNAIGVATLLEIARIFSNRQFRRSLIILLITGEEKGLLGSTYYTDHPIVPLHKTIANINIDGVASYDIFKSIIGVGTEYSSLDKYFEVAAQKCNLSVVQIPPQFKQWESFNRSDQIAFAKAGIPSILTMDAPNYIHFTKGEAISKLIDYNQNIYHTPFDDLKQKINFKAVVQHINFICILTEILLNSKSTPTWNAGTYFNNVRLQTIAEER